MREPSRMETRVLLMSAQANLRAQERILADLKDRKRASRSDQESDRAWMKQAWRRLREHHREVLMHLSRNVDGTPLRQRFQMERTISTLRMEGRELGERWQELDSVG